MSRDFKTPPTFEGKVVLHEKLLNAKGDLLVATANDTVGLVSVGTAGTVLRANSSAEAGVEWVLNDMLLPFAGAGTLSVRTGQARFPVPYAITILGVSAAVGTFPVGSSIILDLNVDGTTVFTNQANRPTIPSGMNAVGETVPSITSISAGSYFTVDIDQVGSTSPGADLNMIVRYRKS